MSMTWDGIGLTWDGDELVWGAIGAGLPAPACPDDLFGTAAPRMLGYLAYYWRCTPHVRALIQPEGYELDYIRTFIDTAPDTSLPADMPEWALDIWEAILLLPTSSGWDVDERRRRVAATLLPAQTGAQIAELIGAYLRVDAADITVAHTALALTVDIAAALSSTDLALATRIADSVRPAHMSLTLTDL